MGLLGSSIPHEIILCPLLFYVDMNDIINLNKEAKYIIYASGSFIFLSSLDVYQFVCTESRV